MPVVQHTLLQLDGVTPLAGRICAVGQVGAALSGGTQTVDRLRVLTDSTGKATFTLAQSAAGSYYVWTDPDGSQYRFAVTSSSGGPYNLTDLLIDTPAALPYVPVGSVGVSPSQLASAVNGLAPLASPALTGTPTENGTPLASTTQLAAYYPPVFMGAHREPHRKLRVHPHPPKVEITTGSTITGAVFYSTCTGSGSAAVVIPPALSVFDFGLRDGQMDTVHNQLPGTYPASYPYDAAVFPSLAKGAPYNSYYVSGYYSGGFATDEPVVEIVAVIGASQGDWQIYQDGQPIFATPQVSNPSSGNSTIRLTNPTRKMRTFELEGGLWLIGVNVSPSGIVTKPPRKTGPKIAFFGDSVAQGTGATTPLLGYAYQTPRLLGWERQEVHAAGGTGFETAGSFLKYVDRVPYLGTDIDALVADGGYNDGDTNATTWAAAVVAFWQAARTRLPNAKLIHIGPWGNLRFSQPAIYTARTAALKTAFAANPGLVDLFIDTVTGGYWFTGTGYAGSPQGDGNSDFYLFSDGVHFSQAGHDYVARRLASALSQFFGFLPADPSILDDRRTWVDTAAHFTAASQPAGLGQFVFESDTGIVRIGDGVTLPASLPKLALVASGATAGRPSPATTIRGVSYFDTTLGKPIWCTGSAWVDATGATV